MIYQREILKNIYPYLETSEILILTGARQVGKTTLLKQLKEKTESLKITNYFLNLENLEFLSLLDKNPENIFKIFPLDKKSKKKSIIFIDEVQFLKNPTNFLKYLFDEYKDNLKLIVSGSSAFYLDKKFKDSLSGRKKIFQINTLGLRDFLVFKEREDLLEYLPKTFDPKNSKKYSKIPLSLSKDLENLVEELMIYGGYPRVVLSEGERKIEIIEEITSSYIKKDIYEAKIRNEEKFYQLFRILSSQVGNQLNSNELANTLNTSKNTIDHYLLIMRKSFHVSLVKPFSLNLRKEITKMPKVYFQDTGLRNFLIRNFNSLAIRQDSGQLFENFIFRQFLDHLGIDQIKFWRSVNKEEVDFILKEKSAFEVKLRSSSFNEGKYSKFKKGYPKIPLSLISHYISKKDKSFTWESWQI